MNKSNQKENQEEKETRAIFIILAIILLIAIGIIVTWYFTRDKKEDKVKDKVKTKEIVKKKTEPERTKTDVKVETENSEPVVYVNTEEVQTLSVKNPEIVYSSDLQTVLRNYNGKIPAGTYLSVFNEATGKDCTGNTLPVSIKMYGYMQDGSKVELNKDEPILDGIVKIEIIYTTVDNGGRETNETITLKVASGIDELAVENAVMSPEYDNTIYDYNVDLGTNSLFRLTYKSVEEVTAFLDEENEVEIAKLNDTDDIYVIELELPLQSHNLTLKVGNKNINFNINRTLSNDALVQEIKVNNIDVPVVLDQTEYEVEVENIEEITVDSFAITVANNATMSELTYEENKAKFTVTSEDGSVSKEYTITVSERTTTEEPVVTRKVTINGTNITFDENTTEYEVKVENINEVTEDSFVTENVELVSYENNVATFSFTDENCETKTYTIIVKPATVDEEEPVENI